MKRAAANADTQDIHITQGPEDDNPNDLEFKLHDHLVLRFVSPNLAKNKNTTQPLIYARAHTHSFPVTLFTHQNAAHGIVAVLARV